MSFLQLYKDYLEGGKHHCRLTAEDEFDEIPCFHCQLADGDCLCDQPEQEGKCPFCVVRELNELIKDADEMAPAVAEGEGLFHVLNCADAAECPKVSPLIACMDALLIARHDLLTSASAWNLPPMDFAKAVMKEVVDLLYLPMTSGRNPCGVAGCCCFLNPLRELVVAELVKDPYLTGDLERMGVLAEGNTEDVRVLTGTLDVLGKRAPALGAPKKDAVLRQVLGTKMAATKAAQSLLGCLGLPLGEAVGWRPQVGDLVKLAPNAAHSPLLPWSHLGKVEEGKVGEVVAVTSGPLPFRVAVGEGRSFFPEGTLLVVPREKKGWSEGGV
jgi:hypothetical protein